jgi:PTH1 family peptidyl-tRNA hydrolase
VRLLVGLGNPGGKYERTRHNVGFRIVEEAARKLGVALEQDRFQGILGTGRVRDEQVAVLLPQTFMNGSGESVGAAARFWKVPMAEVVVVHDELDLPLGRLQVKQGGGDAGHNGLRSLRQHLGPDFLRIRVGIGKAPPQWEGADWVLSRFTPEEEAVLAEIIPQAADAAVTALVEGGVAAMNKFNRREKAPGEEKQSSEEQ